MFKSLFAYKRIPFGPEGQLVAVLHADPPASILTLMARGESILEQLDPTEANPINAALFQIALVLDRWEGDNVPSGDLWPALKTDADVVARMATLAQLPISVINRLAEEVAGALHLKSADRD